MNQSNIDLACARLLTPTGVVVSDLDSVLGEILHREVTLADLYLETTRSEAWSLEDGIVKEGVHSIRQGAGVRAVNGEQTGFAYTDELTLPALREAARVLTREADCAGPIVPFAIVSLRWRLGSSGIVGLEPGAEPGMLL